MTTSDNSLVTFKAISNFTTCLSEVFGNSNRALKLYAHLISKTTLSHDIPIQKHITAVKEFCIANRSAILTKNRKQIQGEIKYSQRVYIDIKTIFSQSDNDTVQIIWKHLLTLSALTDPTAKAKEILQETSKTSANEADFLTNIIGKVEEHVDPNANPMDAVSSIMKSGIFTELVGGMGNGLQDGTLDLSKLMGTVQKMVTSLNDGDDNQKGSDQSNGDPSEIMNTMMSNISGDNTTPPNGMPDMSAIMGMMGGNASNTTAPNGMPDMSSIMGMVGPMLNALSQQGGDSALPDLGSINKGTSSLEQKIDNEVAAAKKSGQFSTITEID